MSDAHQTVVNCARFDAQLSSWLDAELDAFSAAAMERHAAECTRCATLAADLRRIHATAAALPSLAPSRDLWAGIEARIAAPVIPIGIGAPSDERTHVADGRARRRWLRPAAAAAALVLITAGVTHVIETGARSPSVRTASVAAAPSVAVPLAPRDTSASVAPATRVAAASPSVVAPNTLLASAGANARMSEVSRITGNLATHNVEASYDGEISRLRTIVDHNRGNLDSATVAVLEHNLQVIDSAIVQCQRALKHDPGSRFLIESLDNALRSKVELLRTTATMSS